MKQYSPMQLEFGWLVQQAFTGSDFTIPDAMTKYLREQYLNDQAGFLNTSEMIVDLCFENARSSLASFRHTEDSDDKTICIEAATTVQPVFEKLIEIMSTMPRSYMGAVHYFSRVARRDNKCLGEHLSQYNDYKNPFSPANFAVTKAAAALYLEPRFEVFFEEADYAFRKYEKTSFSEYHPKEIKKDKNNELAIKQGLIGVENSQLYCALVHADRMYLDREHIVLEGPEFSKKLLIKDVKVDSPILARLALSILRETQPSKLGEEQSDIDSLQALRALVTTLHYYRAPSVPVRENDAFLVTTVNGIKSSRGEGANNYEGAIIGYSLQEVSQGVLVAGPLEYKSYFPIQSSLLFDINPNSVSKIKTGQALGFNETELAKFVFKDHLLQKKLDTPAFEMQVV